MPEFNIYNYKTKQEALKLIDAADLKKVYSFKLTKKRLNRSISQNSLYWLWLTCIERETGNDKECLHDYFREKYLGLEKIIIFKVEYFRLKSTKLLDTSLFKEYLDKIQLYASSELAIMLPDPKDLEFKRFQNYYSKYL